MTWLRLDAAIIERNFPQPVHPFLRPCFLALNAQRVDELIFLSTPDLQKDMALVFGRKGQALAMPFSSPFGGFYHRNYQAYSDQMDGLAYALRAFLQSHSYSLFYASAPGIYETGPTAKWHSALLRTGFRSLWPEITSYIDLSRFSGNFPNKGVRKYLRQAQENGLHFRKVESEADKRAVYATTAENRQRLGRPMPMGFADFIAVEKCWSVDYFAVESAPGRMVAGAIFYPYHPEVVLGALWGDTAEGRPLRAMNFCLAELIAHYRERGFRFLDLGKSTNDGVPDPGLLRFKETHGAQSELRLRFAFP